MLSGVPGGAGWMAFAAVLGAAISAIVGVVAFRDWQQHGLHGGLLPLGLGLLVGLLPLVVGVAQSFARERLMLDRNHRSGAYASNSPFVTTARPFDFTFDDVAGVVLAFRIETHQTSGPSGRSRAATPSRVWSATLRTTSPRRSVVLDESQSDGEARVRAVAEAVASFIGVDVDDETGEQVEGGPRVFGGTGGGGIDAFDPPAPPPHATHEVIVEPDAGTITIASKRARRFVGSWIIVGMLTTMLLGFVALGVLVLWPGVPWEEGAPHPALKASFIALGVLAVSVLPWLWSSQLLGREVVTISARGLTRELRWPGRSIARCWPYFGARMSSLPRTLALGSIESVRTVKRADERVVEVKAGAGLIRIEPSLDDGEAQRASCVWLAETVRRALRVVEGKRRSD